MIGFLKAKLNRMVGLMVFLPLVLVIAWFGITNRYGAIQGGLGWVDADIDGMNAFVESLMLMHAFRASRMADDVGHQGSPSLMPDEFLVTFQGGKLVASHSGGEYRVRDAEKLQARLRSIPERRAELVMLDGDLCAVARTEEFGQTYLLFRKWGDAFADEVAKVSSTEVVVFVSGHPIASSLKSASGRIPISVPDGLAPRLSGLRQDEHFALLTEAAAPGYLGFFGPTSHGVAGGEDRFSVFQSFSRLGSASGEPVVLSLIVPADVLMAGPQMGLFVSIGFLSLLGSVMSLGWLRLGRRLDASIKRSTLEVNTMIDRIHVAAGDQGAPASADTTAHTLLPSEAVLHTAVTRLNEAIRRSSEMERELKHSQAKLIQSSRMAALGEMSAGVAHEINTPLNVIMGRCTQLGRLLRGPDPDVQKAVAFSEGIGAMAQRIASIVRGLRSFSRSGELDPCITVPLKTMIEDATTLCAERFKNSGIDLRIDDAAELACDCRPQQIVQVLLNLFGNAFDAVNGLPKAWIHLSVRDLGDAVELAVSDGGPGIALAKREWIFQPFFTTKEVGRGTGLGLSISRGLMEDLGGRLVLDSSASHTRFVVILPKRQTAGARAAAEGSAGG